MNALSPARGWTVVLPVKGGADAKSRLLPRDDPQRSALARAVALDTLAAVLCCPVVRETVVVTADDEMARRCSAQGALVAVESAPGAGLLAAIADGLRACGPGPTAVLLADLPATTPADLETALDCALRALDNAPQVFLPDAESTGTVLLAAKDRDALHPAFGTDSAAAHLSLGAVRLDVDLPRIRRDVDTPDSMAQAEALGLGRFTSAVIQSCRALTS